MGHAPEDTCRCPYLYGAAYVISLIKLSQHRLKAQNHLGVTGLRGGLSFCRGIRKVSPAHDGPYEAAYSTTGSPNHLKDYMRR